MSRAATPAVTVILPTCDRPAMLARAIDSVLAQTSDDFELVVVDDGSAVPAEPGCERARRALGGGRVQLIANRVRRGAAAARNAGLRVARAPTIAFLDDDDEWLPEKLARQVAALAAASPDTALVYCGREVVSDRSGRVLERHVPGAPVGFAELLRSTVFPTSVPLVRTSALAEVGGFDEDLPGTQDRDLWLRLARRFRFCSLPDVLVRSHLHGAQISTDLTAKLAAKRRWIAKYEADLARHPDASAHEFLRLGLLNAAAGECAEARRCFLRALRSRPSAGPAAHLVASLVAPRRHRARVLQRAFRTHDGLVLYW